MKDLDEFICMNKDEINCYLEKYSKEELMNFAILNDIPYKKYYSKNKLLEHLVRSIDSTMIFKRISS